MNNKETHFCRVCGLEQETPPWGIDGQTPLFEICDCCGVEFGYEDCQAASIRIFREQWLTQGAQWFNPKRKPPVWSPETQLQQEPTEFQ